MKRYGSAYIPVDPSSSIGRLATDKFKRDVLSIAEAMRLLPIDTVQGARKGDVRLFAANFQTASARMREGELRGLEIKNVYEAYIDVFDSSERSRGRKGERWGTERRVTIPKSVSKLHTTMVEANPYREPKDLVFYGDARDTPFPSRTFIDNLCEAPESSHSTGSESRQILDNAVKNIG